MGQPPPPSPAGPPPPTDAVAAGWYFDGVQQRWWDGQSWGPAAQQRSSDSNDKVFSIITHGGPVIGGFLLPMVFYLISNDDERPETRWHAREALNFQLTFMLVYFASFGIFFVVLAVTGVLASFGSGAEAAVGAGFGLSFVLFFVVAMGLLLLNFGFSIMAALKANDGIRWRYPVRIPFVKG